MSLRYMGKNITQSLPIIDTVAGLNNVWSAKKVQEEIAKQSGGGNSEIYHILETEVVATPEVDIVSSEPTVIGPDE